MNSRGMNVLVTLAMLSASSHAESPFADRVIQFSPAPGQFVNTPEFSDPMKALGAPVGGGTIQPNNLSVVSLGGFGGSITLGFDHTVLDDPLNPMGLDAIVFGNGHWVGGNRDRRWAECATIEISRDVNGNGVPDDPWYLIPGSHIAAPAQHVTATWDDNVNDLTYAPHLASWIPPGRSGVWTTLAFALPEALFGAVVLVNPRSGTGTEGVYGYADLSPTLVLGDLNGDNIVDDAAMTPNEFYTVPDDPFASGITPQSGGGDAFDIAWAIVSETGELANLTGFDFVRISSAVGTVSPVFGEKSAEIDAVADVAPDKHGDHDDDGDIDLYDVAGLQRCFGSWVTSATDCEGLDRKGDRGVDWRDAAYFLLRMTGPI